jgi:hypothetical protein
MLSLLPFLRSPRSRTPLPSIAMQHRPTWEIKFSGRHRQSRNILIAIHYMGIAAHHRIGVLPTPSVVAFRYKHRHHNAVAILVLNLLLGWTLIGWMVALVWALTKPPPPPAPR